MLTEPSSGPVAPVGLDVRNLNVPKENTYFVIALLLSIVVWLALVISIVGAVYGVIIGFFLWLGNGLLTAHLRSEAVRVGPDQLPQLDATFKDVCAKLGLQTPPALYVVQAGGALNAFATRFAGRNFVVVFSDFLEALGPDSAEMRFILGHELGHIQSNHVLKHIFLAPGLIAPLIGPAYRRAWESSCDRYGAFAAQDVGASARAMLVLSGGAGHGKSLNASAFAGQHTDERGFFVSLHELTSTYPTLSRRVTDLIALRDGQAAPAPNRNPLAYVVALFVPGGNLGSGGPASALIVVVVIGLMAAMAIPAFQKVRQSSEAKVCLNNQRMLASALDEYQLEHNAGPKTWAEIAGPGKLLKAMPKCPRGGTYSAEKGDDGYTVHCSIVGHNGEPATAGMKR